MDKLARARWRKSTRSGNSGNCVETAFAEDAVYVRDSKDPHGPVLTFTRDEWKAFTEGVKLAEFDL